MAAGTIMKAYRGPASGLPTLEAGQFGWTTDTNILYVGTGTGNKAVLMGSQATAAGLALMDDANAAAQLVTLGAAAVTDLNGVRPFAAPVITVEVNVPDTIDATGTDDVSADLEAFIAGVASGTTINFPANAVYRIDGAIFLEHNHHLILDGHGCTIKYTSVTGTTGSYSCFYAEGAGNDLWIRNFVLIGSSPHPGVYTPGESPTGGEGQHGIISSFDRTEISGCTMSLMWGDGIYIEAGATGVWIHDNIVASAGRQGISIIAAENVLMERNTITASGYRSFDVEPNTGTDVCRDIVFRNNTIVACSGEYIFNIVNTAETTVDNIVIDDNRVTGDTLSIYADAVGAVRMTRIVFTNNIGVTAVAGPVLFFYDIDGLTVYGNVQPLSSGEIKYSSGCTQTLASTVELTDMAVMAQDKIIGRATASTGVPEVIDCTATGRSILDDTSTAAVLTTIGALPLAGGTMSGDVTLGENTAIALDPAGSADEKWSGITVTGTAGATLAVGDLCYLNSSFKWVLADADAASTSGSVALGLCVLAAAGDTDATRMLLVGTMRSAAFPASITGGAQLYVSQTAGDMTTTIPTGADVVVRVCGWAILTEPNTVYFAPSSDYITRVS